MEPEYLQLTLYTEKSLTPTFDFWIRLYHYGKIYGYYHIKAGKLKQ